jgi:simple sugar transport system ATP-binding protein
MTTPETTPSAAVSSTDPTRASSAPLVDLRGIRKSYGAVDVLRGVDLTLARGEVLGLVGDNGAGKSTLMKVLAGSVQHDGGEIRIKGEEVRFHSPSDAQARDIGIVYQDLALCDSLNVAANLFLGREPRVGPFLRVGRMHEEATEVLREFGVRVTASADLDILILDEPTAALAVTEVESVLRLIKEVAARGVGVILITHRLQDLFRVCDRITVMYEGRSVDDARIDDLTIESLVGMITREGSAAA